MVVLKKYDIPFGERALLQFRGDINNLLDLGLALVSLN